LNARKLAKTTALLGLVVASMATLLELSERDGSAVKKHLYSEESPTRTLNVATVAMEIDLVAAKNRRKIASLIREIVRQHPEVEFVVFGEAILGWFYAPPDTQIYVCGRDSPSPVRPFSQ
jgi:hypothetical protein